MMPVDPIIVVGMGSSGTRLVVRLLERVRVFMGGPLSSNEFAEPEIFFRGVNAFTDEFRYRLPLPLNWRERVAVERPRILEFCEKVLERAYREAGYTGGRWGFKDPRNTFTAHVFLEAFPTGQVLHILRDGLDVAETKCKENWLNLPPDRNLGYWLEVWKNAVEVADAYSCLGRRYHLIRYEDLCMHREVAISSLAAITEYNLDVVRAAVRDLARPDRIGKVAARDRPQLEPRLSALRRRFGYD